MTTVQREQEHKVTTTSFTKKHVRWNEPRFKFKTTYSMRF